MNLILRKSDTLVTKMKALIGYHFRASSNTEKKAKEVAEVFSSEDILSGMVCVYASEYVGSPYTPAAVLEKMDLGGGSLNYKGITDLRTIERCVVHKKAIFCQLNME